MQKRYPNGGKDLRERLDYELGVIKSMGYVDYFLIVWDFINFARSNGIAGGAGTRFGGRKHRGLLSRDHRHRPDPISTCFSSGF